MVGGEAELAERGFFVDLLQRGLQGFAVGGEVLELQVRILRRFGQELDAGVGLGGELIGRLAVLALVAGDELLVLLGGVAGVPGGSRLDALAVRPALRATRGELKALPPRIGPL